MTASPQRTRVLRFIKTLQPDEPIYTYLLKQATGLPSGTILPMLRWLLNQGHVRQERETQTHYDGTQRRPPRTLYYLTETGKALVESTPEDD